MIYSYRHNIYRAAVSLSVFLLSAMLLACGDDSPPVQSAPPVTAPATVSAEQRSADNLTDVTGEDDFTYEGDFTDPPGLDGAQDDEDSEAARLREEIALAEAEIAQIQQNYLDAQEEAKIVNELLEETTAEMQYQEEKVKELEAEVVE